MGTTAILLVHGILGRPEQFKGIVPLIPKEWTVRNITLKGHGGTPKEFGRYPMSEWKAEVHEEATKLCEQYDHVLMVGHSLGTLFSMQEALALPIEGLFLTNIPLGVKITPKLVKLSVQVFLDKIDQKDEFIVAAKNAYGISHDCNIFHYIKWIPRYFELFSEISNGRKIVSDVKTDTVVLLSSKDEMAAPKKTADILRKKTNMEPIIMPESGHFYYASDDLKIMQNAFLDFIKKHEENA